MKTRNPIARVIKFKRPKIKDDERRKLEAKELEKKLEFEDESGIDWND